MLNFTTSITSNRFHDKKLQKPQISFISKTAKNSNWFHDHGLQKPQISFTKTKHMLIITTMVKPQIGFIKKFYC